MDKGEFHNPHVHLDVIWLGQNFEPENPVLYGLAKVLRWN
jgi:hypothetical protein